MTENWRVAKSLLTLRDQINRAAPNRSKASDGLIGDTAHSKTKSDHNPDKDGVVKAMDITHDPSSGVDGTILTESLVASRDKRIQYIIWNRKIISSTVQPWVWRGYSGSNPHNHHVHISVKADPKLYDDTSLWGFQLAAFNRPVQAPTPRPAPVQPAPSSPPLRVSPEPEDALVEPDTRSPFRKFIDAIAEWFAGGEKKWPGR
jgi:hypothetical protein